MSVNIDFDKLDRQKLLSKTKQLVFVTEDGKTAECFDDFGKKISSIFDDDDDDDDDAITAEVTKTEVHSSRHAKPKMSYAQLIAEALLTGPDRMLTLNEIYIAINKQHPYYSLDASTGRNWQNAIRSA